jgi:Holliday junction resolvasome RuvABC endonuclease subunit
VILAIDPGLHSCGVAIFDTNTSLVWAGLVKNSVDAHPENPTFHQMLWNGMVDAVDAKLRALRYKPDRMAIELPQVYIASRSKGDPADLIMLTGVVGSLVHWFSGMSFLYKPYSWKGNVPKAIMSERILKRLNDDEQRRIEKAPKSLWHNTIDAVGIGLHHLKRL